MPRSSSKIPASVKKARAGLIPSSRTDALKFEKDWEARHHKPKRRRRYEVREVVIYSVLAHSPKEAEELIASDPQRDKLVTSVEDREAYLP